LNLSPIRIFIRIELGISELIGPIANQLALFHRESDKLKSAAQFPLVSHQGARAHGNANLRDPKFNRDLLSD
jgi:hypothetical protein